MKPYLSRTGICLVLFLSTLFAVADESIGSEATVTYGHSSGSKTNPDSKRAMRLSEQRRITKKRAISVNILVIGEHPEGFLVSMSTVTTQVTEKVLTRTQADTPEEVTSASTSTNVSTVKTKQPIGPGWLAISQSKTPKKVRVEKRISDNTPKEPAVTTTSRTYTESRIVTQQLGNAVVVDCPEWYVEGSEARATLYPAGRTQDGQKLYARSLGTALAILIPPSSPSEPEPMPDPEPEPTPEPVDVVNTPTPRTIGDGFRDAITMPMKRLGFMPPNPNDDELDRYQDGFATGVWVYVIMLASVVFLVRSRLSRN